MKIDSKITAAMSQKTSEEGFHQTTIFPCGRQ